MERGTAKASHALRLPLGAADLAKPSARARVVTTLLVLAAVACAVLPIPTTARAVAAMALLALGMLVQRWSLRPAHAPRGWVTIDGAGITRVDGGGPSAIARWSDPFGLTILGNPDRTRLLLAFTTAAQTRYLSVRVDVREGAPGAHPLLDRASTIADSDVEAARGERDPALRPADAERLLEAIASRARSSLDRIYLTDTRGDAVVLDSGKLRLGHRVIDLSTPLEWRGFMFQESGGRVTTLYQATWVRQAEAEAVLISPLPAESSWVKDLAETARETGAADSLAKRAVVRDLCLMQSHPEEPPPRELRLAIDRMFMLPLRQALDRAPRISRAPALPPRRPSWPEGRA